MISRILGAGLFAGLCAGLFVALLQHFSATPLILKAETFEVAMAAPGRMAARADHAFGLGTALPAVILVHGQTGAVEPAEWKPENGVQRTVLTTLVTVATSMAFALLVLGALLLRGDEMSTGHALAYGMAGFFAFGLLPAAGLAPELPGASAAPLMLRQAWWITTALASLAGFALFFSRQPVWLKAIALALVLVPHLVGAPHPEAMESKVPAELAARFAALSLALQAVLWLASAYAAAFFWRKLAPRAEAA